MLTLIILVLGPSRMRAQQILFDSFTPPITAGGFSSANGGNSIQVSVTSDVRVGGISVLNRMYTEGNLRFVVLSHPQHQFIYLSPPKAFPADLPDFPTWKQSDPMEFTFLAGHDYLVGYLRSVPVDDVGDRIAESSSGITSELACHCLSNYSSPTYSHNCLNSVDFAVRIYTVPEPSTLLLIGIGAISLVGYRKAKLHG